MTHDEIIEMARQAGSIDSEDVILTIYNAFASAEREACAKVCEKTITSQRSAWGANFCIAAIRARGDA
jgi:hypothetical protein